METAAKCSADYFHFPMRPAQVKSLATLRSFGEECALGKLRRRGFWGQIHRLCKNGLCVCQDWVGGESRRIHRTADGRL